MSRAWSQRVLVVLLTMGFLAVSLAAFRNEDYRTYPFRNGDHMYYVSTALQMVGKGYGESLASAARMFPDWPGKPSNLYYGYLNQSVAPLIYPRVALPALLAVAIGLLGIAWYWIPVAALGILSVVLMRMWTRLHFGTGVAMWVLPAAAASAMFVRYGFGLYVEALMICTLAALLVLLPAHMEDAVVKRTRLWGLAGGVMLLALTRQMPWVPIIIVWTGYSTAYVKSRQLRNTWLVPTVVVTVTAVLSYAVLAKWAPYNPLPYLSRYYDITGRREFLSWLPGHYVSGLATVATTAIRVDPLSLLLVVLLIIGQRVARRPDLVALLVALVAAASVNLLLNRPEYRFMAATTVVLIPLAAVGLATVTRSIAPVSTTTASVGAYRTVSFALWAVLAVVTAMGVREYGTKVPGVVRYDVPTVAGNSVVVDPTGPVSCRGDDAQLWLHDDSRGDFALTGTALSHGYGAQTLAAYNADATRPLTQSQVEALAVDCLARVYPNGVPNP